MRKWKRGRSGREGVEERIWKRGYGREEVEGRMWQRGCGKQLEVVVEVGQGD